MFLCQLLELEFSELINYRIYVIYQSVDHWLYSLVGDFSKQPVSGGRRGGFIK